jgi:hypothetical protein
MGFTQHVAVESNKSDTGTDDLYVLSLWYFDDIDFLRDHEIQLNGTSTMDEMDGTEDGENITISHCLLIFIHFCLFNRHDTSHFAILFLPWSSSNSVKIITEFLFYFLG